MFKDNSVAPFVPSQVEVVRRMLEVAQVGSDDVVYDLGCGDGRILFTAVREFGAKRAVGYELRDDLYRKVVREIESQGLRGRVRVLNRDLFDADITEATVITLYLTTFGNERLEPKLRREARYGARVVSHDFNVKPWQAVRKESFHGHTVYLFVVPQSFSGREGVRRDWFGRLRRLRSPW
ncbi:MAG: SAM-dependent methyltransferase [Candidatus Bathyarchaeia archaeon]